PVKEARPHEPGVWLYSENEPEDIGQFLRIGKNRLRKYETNVEAYLSVEKNAATEAMLPSWRAKIQAKFNNKWDRDLALVYMRWRVNKYLAEHPDQDMPKQVILWMRVYRVPDPEEVPKFDGPYNVPIARWLPGGKVKNHSPIEPYDPVSKRFYLVKENE